MADLVFGIRLTADGSGYVGTVRLAAQETEALGAAAHKASKGVDETTGSMTKAVAIGSELGRVIGDVARKVLEWAAATVTSAAELKDWSDQTGSSVESLSRLSNVAKISGVSMGELQIATQRLSYNLAGTDDESRKTTRALEVLGITTRDPAQAMEQLALKLAQYRDGAEKAALVQDILGRGAQRLLPYLKDLAEQQKVGATVSTEQAEEAEKLEKSLRALTVQASELRDMVLSGLVPALNTLLQTAREFGTLPSIFAFMGIGKAERDDPVAAVVETRNKIASVREQIEALSSDRLSAKLNRLFSPEDLPILNAQLVTLLARLKALEGAAGSLEARDPFEAWGKPPAPITPARAKALVDPLAKELDRLAEKWQNLFAAKQSSVDMATVKSLEELDKLLDAGRISWAEYVEGINLALDADKKLADEQKTLNEIESAYAKMLDELDDAEQKRIAGIRKTVDALEEQNTKLRDEIEVVGLTGAARDLRLSQLERERALTAATNDVERDRINQLYDERDALIRAKGAAEDYVDAQKKAAEQQRELFDKADSLAREAFGAIFEHGDGTFKRLGESLKKNLIDVLYAMIVRPWLIQVVASLTGANASSLANLAGGGGGGFNPLNLLTGDRSLTNRAVDFLGGGPGTGSGSFDYGAGASGAASGADLAAGSADLAASGTADFFGAGAWGEAAAAPIIEAGTTIAEAGSIFAGAAVTLGTAIPVIGAVLAIAYAAGLFNKKPSEVRGQFGISSGTTGFEDNAYVSSGAGNLGFVDANTQQFSGDAARIFDQIVGGAIDAFEQRYSPAQRDRLTQVLQATTFPSAEGSYTTEDFIKTYGGQVLQQVVSAAFDVLDPALGSVVRNFHGTADEISKFGNTLLGVYDATKQINNADFTANVDAALQGADQATADKVLAFVTIVAQFGDSIEGLGPRLLALDPDKIVAFVDALGGAQSAMSAFAFFNANFTTSADRAANAQTNLTHAWDAAGVTAEDLARAGLDHLPRTHAEFVRLFDSLITGDERSQHLAATLLERVAPAFVAVEGTADAAAAGLQHFLQIGKAALSGNNALLQRLQDDQRFIDEQLAGIRGSSTGVRGNVANANVTHDLLNGLPETDAEWRRLINTIDDGTEAGKRLRDSTIAMYGAWLDAKQAFDQSAADFHHSALFTPQEQRQYDIQHDVDAITAAEAQLHIAIPRTSAGFRDLVTHLEDVAEHGTKAESDAAKAQLAVLYLLVPEILDYNKGLSDQLTLVQSVGSIIKVSADAAKTLLGKFANLASQSTGDFGAKLALQIGLIDNAIANTDRSDFTSSTAFNTYVGTLRATDNKFKTELAEFNRLTLQYDASRAEQLIALEEWRDEQNQIFHGMPDDLAVVQQIFDQRWQAIVDGSADAAKSLDDFIKSIEQLGQSTGGNAGQQAQLELALSSARLAQLQTQYAAALPGSALATALQADITKLTAYNATLATRLAHFTGYAAQYGAAIANQLVGLETDFEQWKLAVGDNADALAVLTAIFNDRFADIIKGVSAGVDELGRVQQQIADYLKSLQLSNLSPLTPKAQLDQAQAAYLDDLAKASPSNTDEASRLKALSDITKLADDYLKQAQSYFSAPSQAYKDIFDEVTHDLGGLAGSQPNGLPLTTTANDTVAATTALAAAVPVAGAKIASNVDIQKQTETLQRLAADSADAASQDAATIIETLVVTSRRVAETVSGSALK